LPRTATEKIDFCTLTCLQGSNAASGCHGRLKFLCAAAVMDLWPPLFLRVDVPSCGFSRLCASIASMIW
jgi:hypothetical protein